MLYVLKRMGTWAGPTQGCVEYIQDSTAPLWSARLLAHELGPSPRERVAERFHRQLLEELAPSLTEVPFEGVRSARDSRSDWQRRAAHLLLLARRATEGWRRANRLRSQSPQAGKRDDPLAPVLATVREHVHARPDHPAWQILDRRRVGQLLDRGPVLLDGTRCQYIWRLATIFLIDDLA